MNTHDLHPAAFLAIAAARSVRRFGRYAGSRHILKKHGAMPHRTT